MKRPQIIKMSLLLRTANNIKWKKPSFLFFLFFFHCQVGMKKSPGGQVAEMTKLEIGLRWLDAALWRSGNSSDTHSRSVSRAPQKLFPSCSFHNCQKGRNFFRKGKIFIYLFIFRSFKSTVFFGIGKKSNVRINLRAEAVAAERLCRLVCSGCHQIPTGFASSSPCCFCTVQAFHLAALRTYRWWRSPLSKCLQLQGNILKIDCQRSNGLMVGENIA